MLLDKSDLPEWYKPYEFIHTGYRKPDVSLFQAISTMFQWHNETLNIHTHLWPGIAFLQGLYMIVQGQSFPILSIYSKFTVITGYLGAISLMFASSLCHTFYIINESWNSAWWKADFSGIVLVNLGRQIADTFLLAIVLFKAPLYFFIGVFIEISFAIYCIYQILYIDNAGSYWGLQYPGISSVILLIPLILYSQGSNSFFLNHNVQAGIFREATLYSLLCSLFIFVAGIVFFKGKFPERFFNPNGIFDHCHSHVWHHLCIVLAIVSMTCIAPLLVKLDPFINV